MRHSARGFAVAVVIAMALLIPVMSMADTGPPQEAAFVNTMADAYNVGDLERLVSFDLVVVSVGSETILFDENSDYTNFDVMGAERPATMRCTVSLNMADYMQADLSDHFISGPGEVSAVRRSTRSGVGSRDVLLSLAW